MARPMLRLNKIIACISGVAFLATGCSAGFFLFEDPTITENIALSEKHANLPTRIEHQNKITKSQIKDWELFGKLEQRPSLESAGGDYEETSLSVSVSGILSAPFGNGWAIASIDKNEQRVLKRGDEISSGVFIARLTPDYIILDNHGRPEKVTLRDFSDSKSHNLIEKVPATASESESEEKRNEELSGLLQAIRNAGLKRASKNNATGYIVISSDKKINTQFGLKEGDLIKSVNGYPVGSDAADDLAFRTYQRTGKASVELSRSGKVIYLEYPP